jgi:putative ABC transport system permease protein
MRIVSLILKEIRYRKVSFILSLVAVLTAVALFVAFVTAGEAYRLETRKIQLGMGQNLRIIPKETPMDKFWSVGFSEYTMPEDYVHRFAALEGYEYTHLTGTLHTKVRWRDKDVILTGILPEVMPPDQKQPPMTFSVRRGDAYIGFELARMLDIKAGDEIEIFGKPFHVAKCLSQSGSSDDVRIYGHLHDIQRVVGLEGRINEIRALECLCMIESGRTNLDALTLAQRQLAEILPDAKVLLLQGIADVRQRQRAAMEGYLAWIMPVVIVACGAWIGLLAMLNVRQRLEEIGLMYGLGYGSGKIALLFLGRSVVIGLAGALLGFVGGTALALYFGPGIFKTTARAIEPKYAWLLWSLVMAPIFAAVSSFIPTVAAVTCDPAITLGRESR